MAIIDGLIFKPGGTTNLQQAYNNSIDPEIVTDTTRIGLTLRRGSAADTDPLICFENAAMTETGRIQGDGDAVLNNLTLSALTTPGFMRNSALGVLSGGNSVDISADTNLAVTSPITLTGDTVGFDFSTNNTWTGTNTFNGAVVINEAGADQDTRIEGGDDPNLWRTHAASNTVAIATDQDLTGASTALAIRRGSPTSTISGTSNEAAQFVVDNNASGNIRCLFVEAELTNTTSNGNACQGLNSFARYSGTGDSTTAGGIKAGRYEARISSSASIVATTGIETRAYNIESGTPTLTNGRAIRIVNSPIGSGTVTNQYGILIEALSGATNNFAIASEAGNIHGFGTLSPLATAHVDQSSATAAIPTLYLDQADLSEEMVEFNTTIGTGNPIEAVGAKTLTTTHFIRVTLPGGLSRYIPVGTIA